MSDGSKRFPASRLILIAALAGAIVGAVAVYVRESGSGNNAEVASAADDVACAAKADKAKAVGAAATGEVAAMQAANPPMSMKGLTFDGPDGKEITLANRSGKTLLVNLWATWCVPCRAEMPALNALEKSMGDDRFEVVAINVDTGDNKKPEKFRAENGIDTLGFYRDATMGVFNDMKKRGLALGLPVTVLVDPEGCLLANMNGPAEWASEDAKRLIKTALDG